jgi:hypothetical protein
VENHLQRTSASNAAGRVVAVEPKKSRPKEKGLRKLSQRAYEIVLKMRSASYKEVANKLVDELNSEQELDQEVPFHSLRVKTNKISNAEYTTRSTSSSLSGCFGRRDVR